jgi:hypothetical protein
MKNLNWDKRCGERFSDKHNNSCVCTLPANHSHEKGHKGDLIEKNKVEAFVKNKASVPNRVWVFGCLKSDLVKAGVKDIISEHDFYDWIFSIPRKDAVRLGILKKEW